VSQFEFEADVMKETVSVQRAEQEFGITCPHELMENGELRFRLFGQDGNGYVRTVASSNGGWQNAHSHTAFRELYLVETGWMALATASREPNVAEISVYQAGETFVTTLGLVHNVYLSANATIHTIKFGIRGPQPKWEPALWFNDQTNHLSEADIRDRTRKPAAPNSN
jgi:hypothetical protein